MSKIPYRELIGSLLFIAQISRPDISFAVNLLSRFNGNPGAAHWKAAKRTLRYLSGTKELELIYGGSHRQLTGFCDADWAGDTDSRKSTTGYLFTMNGGAITWNTKKQATVALSTTEAEFMSMVACIQEGMWLKQLLAELFTTTEENIKIFCDNKGAIDLAKNNAFSPRSKHIDIKHKFVHEKISNNEVSVEMPADILTKVLKCAQEAKSLSTYLALV